MNNNKNTSSKLDGLFENTRKQEPVMNLNEVSDLLKNPAAFQKKDKSNSIRWFGMFLLIGLAAFGSFYFYNRNSSTDEKSGNDFTVTTVTPSNSNTVPQKAPVQDKTNEIAASDNSKNNISSTENSLNENNKEVKNSAVHKEVATEKSGKTTLPPVEPGSKPGTVNRHYEGNSTVNFLSDDNKKIKMIVTPSNEVEELKINDETISNDKYSSYKYIIDEGLKLKKTNTKGGSESANNVANSEKQNIMNAMMKELSADGLVSSNEPFDFTLTGQEVILNNEKQSQVTFEKYKQVYEKVTGEKLPAKYNLHIKR